jgi:hypothetical protein
MLCKEFVIKKLLAHKEVGGVGAAQLKITAVLIYYTVLGVMGMTTATVSLTSYAASTNTVEYLLCESMGMSDCTFDSGFLNINSLAVVVVVLFSLLPVVAIFFTCDPRVCRRKTKASVKKSSTILELTSSLSHAPRLRAGQLKKDSTVQLPV